MVVGDPGEGQTSETQVPPVVFRNTYILFYVYEDLAACIPVWHISSELAEARRRATELKFQIVVSCHVGARNGT